MCLWWRTHPMSPSGVCMHTYTHRHLKLHSWASPSLPPREISCYRMYIIEKTGDNKCLQGCLERGALIHCGWKRMVVKTLWELMWRFIQKLKIETIIEPSYITSRCISKDSVSCHRQICTPVFTGELFRMSGKWNHRTCPRSYEWMRKLLYMYTVKFDSAVKQWSYKVLSGKY